jgi:hypothetical protein
MALCSVIAPRTAPHRDRTAQQALTRSERALTTALLTRKG